MYISSIDINTPNHGKYFTDHKVFVQLDEVIGLLILKV